MRRNSNFDNALIFQFRARVSDLKLEDDSDMFLIRWLRGKSGLEKCVS